MKFYKKNILSQIFLINRQACADKLNFFFSLKMKISQLDEFLFIKKEREREREGGGERDNEVEFF